MSEALRRWNRKRKQKNKFGIVSDAPFPHCDQRVLHAPGECEVCDMYPHFQELRKAWGICFTGKHPETDEIGNKQVLCPSDYNRGYGGAHVWGRNRPHKS